ncbi:MAG: AroM family protein [Candidatus Bathyarchaeota archaeon]|nr:AroM family protein [Candidatus Bathyarchaeota archaeon]
MKIGLITIGQTPRTDVTPTLREMLGKEAEFIEKGALDGLTKKEIEKLAPTKKDYVLVTRLKDGTPVKVARRYIAPKIQKCLKELEEMGVSLNLLLCTGEFPRLKAEKPLLMPEALITNVMRCVKGGKIGVVVPEKEQISYVERKWRSKGISTIVAYANPYGESKALEDVAKFLAKKNVDLIVLDCIGFTPKAKELVRHVTGKPVLLPQTLIGNVLKDLFGSP